MRKAVVVGFDYFARYLSRLVNEHARDWRLEFYPGTRLGTMRALYGLRSADALIAFGGPSPNGALTLAARENRVPVIVVWAGTDLLVAAENPFDMEVAKQYVHSNLTGAPWLADELRQIGVYARYQQIIGVDTPQSIAPLPNRFTVLTYLPEPRREFYGCDRVYAIARNLKDTRFIVVGAGDRDPTAPENVEFRGFVKNVGRVIDESTVLLRLPAHDGPAMMVLEALARGRHAVWTHDFPGVERVDSVDEALAAVRTLRDQHRTGMLTPNLHGRAYVAGYCSRARVAESIEATLDLVLHPRRRTSRRRRKRVAISGYGLFCADLARNIERLHPEWEAQILRQGSRVEALSSLLHLGRSHVWYTIGSPRGSRWMHYCAKALGIPRVMHWVGSDIENARTDAAVRRSVRASKAMHLAEIDWTAAELAEMGLDSKILPLPGRHQGDGVRPLPERFTILLYVPRSRAEFYGLREYEKLLRDLSDEQVRVFVVGGGSVSAPKSLEVINCGWRTDLRDVYEQSTVLVRFTPHDGLALMAVEALSFGRHLIWTRPFAYSKHVSTYDELLSETRVLLDKHKAGTLHAQYAAAELVRERYGTERCVGDILATLEEARVNAFGSAG